METTVFDCSSGAGLRWEFRPEGGGWRPIAVPAGGWKTQGFSCDAGTYRVRVPVPPGTDGMILRIAFAAVNFGAEVLAGPDERSIVPVASHVNGWLPFSAEIPPACRAGGAFILVVRVRGRRAFLRDGKFLVPEGASWYDGVADGIIRGVSLEVLPPVCVEDVFVRTSVAEDALLAEATVRNATGARVSATIEAALGPDAGGPTFEYPRLPPVPVALEPGETRTVTLGRAGWGLGPASFWFPNVPFRPAYRAVLHRLRVRVRPRGGTAHERTVRFGFREFRVAGGRYELNGIRCNLRGDNQQEANFGTDAYGVFPGFGPPAKGNPGWPRAVENLLRLNFNVLRIHQIPATPYMLDVCDERGLMIVGESPVRGSERLEDFVGGREHMVAFDRGLALRDRNHPSVVLWSVGNETWGERGLVLACTAAVLAADDTRPVVADGVADLGEGIVAMQHYTAGLGAFPGAGGTPRADRPYGETEAIWPVDNTRRGFAWMATATRIRRLKGNCDIRNYVLNNAWSNYVPGQRPELQVLERKVKKMTGYPGNLEILPALRSPWTDPNIRLMQNCFHPTAVCDVRFDEENKLSNDAGDWPTVRPRLAAGTTVERLLAVFNDEFAGTAVAVRWELRRNRPTGRLCASGGFAVDVPLGAVRTRPVSVPVPEKPGTVFLVLRLFKDGEERFVEDRVAFEIAPPER